MNRRELLNAVTQLLGGAMVGSAAMRVLAGETPTLSASRSILGSTQSQMIAALAEMIIPKTDTPGAIEAGVPSFIGMMVTDWYTDTERRIFFAGLLSLDTFCLIEYQRKFLDCDDAQRVAALSDAEKRASSYVSPLPGGLLGAMTKQVDEKTPFFTKIKELTAIGYFSSEIGATKEMAYDPMPMHYEGDYDFAQIGRYWSF